jgi:hypothetical protein
MGESRAAGVRAEITATIGDREPGPGPGVEATAAADWPADASSSKPSQWGATPPLPW